MKNKAMKSKTILESLKSLLNNRALKRRMPYAPLAYIGRKDLQKILHAKVLKKSQLEKRMNTQANSSSSNN